MSRDKHFVDALGTCQGIDLLSIDQFHQLFDRDRGYVAKVYASIENAFEQSAAASTVLSSESTPIPMKSPLISQRLSADGDDEADPDSSPSHGHLLFDRGRDMATFLNVAGAPHAKENSDEAAQRTAEESAEILESHATPILTPRSSSKDVTPVLSSASCASVRVGTVPPVSRSALRPHSPRRAAKSDSMLLSDDKKRTVRDCDESTEVAAAPSFADRSSSALSFESVTTTGTESMVLASPIPKSFTQKTLVLDVDNTILFVRHFMDEIRVGDRMTLGDRPVKVIKLYYRMELILNAGEKVIIYDHCITSPEHVAPQRGNWYPTNTHRTGRINQIEPMGCEIQFIRERRGGVELAVEDLRCSRRARDGTSSATVRSLSEDEQDTTETDSGFFSAAHTQFIGAAGRGDASAGSDKRQTSSGSVLSAVSADGSVISVKTPRIVDIGDATRLTTTPLSHAKPTSGVDIAELLSTRPKHKVRSPRGTLSPKVVHETTLMSASAVTRPVCTHSHSAPLKLRLIEEQREDELTVSKLALESTSENLHLQGKVSQGVLPKVTHSRLSTVARMRMDFVHDSDTDDDDDGCVFVASLSKSSSDLREVSPEAEPVFEGCMGTSVVELPFDDLKQELSERDTDERLADVINDGLLLGFDGCSSQSDGDDKDSDASGEGELIDTEASKPHSVSSRQRRFTEELSDREQDSAEDDEDEDIKTQKSFSQSASLSLAERCSKSKSSSKSLLPFARTTPRDAAGTPSADLSAPPWEPLLEQMTTAMRRVRSLPTVSSLPEDFDALETLSHNSLDDLKQFRSPEDSMFISFTENSEALIKLNPVMNRQGLIIADLLYGGYLVRFRPGLLDFFLEVKTLFDVVLFTAADGTVYTSLLEEVHKTLINELKNRYSHSQSSEERIAACDEIRLWSKVLYRNDCDERMSHFGQVFKHKNIAKLGRDLGQTVIIDDNPMSFAGFEPNAIRIASFWGLAEPSDNELLARILPILRTVARHCDVRYWLTFKCDNPPWDVQQAFAFRSEKGFFTAVDILELATLYMKHLARAAEMAQKRREAQAMALMRSRSANTMSRDSSGASHTGTTPRKTRSTATAAQPPLLSHSSTVMKTAVAPLKTQKKAAPSRKAAATHPVKVAASASASTKPGRPSETVPVSMSSSSFQYSRTMPDLHTIRRAPARTPTASAATAAHVLPSPTAIGVSVPVHIPQVAPVVHGVHAATHAAVHPHARRAAHSVAPAAAPIMHYPATTATHGYGHGHAPTHIIHSAPPVPQPVQQPPQFVLGPDGRLYQLQQPTPMHAMHAPMLTVPVAVPQTVSAAHQAVRPIPHGTAWHHTMPATHIHHAAAAAPYGHSAAGAHQFGHSPSHHSHLAHHTREAHHAPAHYPTHIPPYHHHRAHHHRSEFRDGHQESASSAGHRSRSSHHRKETSHRHSHSLSKIEKPSLVKSFSDKPLRRKSRSSQSGTLKKPFSSTLSSASPEFIPGASEHVFKKAYSGGDLLKEKERLKALSDDSDEGEPPTFAKKTKSLPIRPFSGTCSRTTSEDEDAAVDMNNDDGAESDDEKEEEDIHESTPVPLAAAPQQESQSHTLLMESMQRQRLLTLSRHRKSIDSVEVGRRGGGGYRGSGKAKHFSSLSHLEKLDDLAMISEASDTCIKSASATPLTSEASPLMGSRPAFGKTELLSIATDGRRSARSTGMTRRGDGKESFYESPHTVGDDERRGMWPRIKRESFDSFLSTDDLSADGYQVALGEFEG